VVASGGGKQLDRSRDENCDVARKWADAEARDSKIGLATDETAWPRRFRPKHLGLFPASGSRCGVISDVGDFVCVCPRSKRKTT